MNVSETGETFTGTKLDKPVWSSWATAGFGAVILLVFTLTQLFVVLAFLFSQMVPETSFDVSRILGMLNDNLGLIASWTTVISGIIGVGLIVAIIKIRPGAKLGEYLSLKLASWKAIIFGLAITLGLIVLAGVLSDVFKIPADDEFTVNIYRTSGWMPLLWVALVIFAPVFEESLFRGFLFAGFRNSRLGIAGTIVITSLLWAALHIQYGAFGLGVVFSMGILLGIMRNRTGSLMVPLLMHGFFNLVALVGLTFGTG